MIVKHFKLSQPEKDRLIRIKAKTGIQNWNVLCPLGAVLVTG